MAFIIPSDKVARLINSIETVQRCLTGFYHDMHYKAICNVIERVVEKKTTLTPARTRSRN